MEKEGYDNIEYETDWQTVQTVTSKPAKTSIYRGHEEMYIDHEEEGLQLPQRQRLLFGRDIESTSLILQDMLTLQLK